MNLGIIEEGSDFLFQNNQAEYAAPPVGESVSRFDHCPCFDMRLNSLGPEDICWFCRFAAFDLTEDRLPERGRCQYSNP